MTTCSTILFFALCLPLEVFALIQVICNHAQLLRTHTSCEIWSLRSLIPTWILTNVRVPLSRNPHVRGSLTQIPYLGFDVTRISHNAMQTVQWKMRRSKLVTPPDVQAASQSIYPHILCTTLSVLSPHDGLWFPYTKLQWKTELSSIYIKWTPCLPYGVV